MSGVEERSDYMNDRLNTLVALRIENAMDLIIPAVLKIFSDAKELNEVKKYTFSSNGLTFKQGTTKRRDVFDNGSFIEPDNNYYVYKRKHLILSKLVLHFSRHPTTNFTEVFVYKTGFWEVRLKEIKTKLRDKKDRREQMRREKARKDSIAVMNDTRRELMKNFDIREDML